MSAAQWLIDHSNISGRMPFTQGYSGYDLTGQAAADEAAREESYQANTLGGKIGDFFGLSNHKSEAEYWKTISDRLYEQNATQSARAWDEYMQSTQYQRMVKDLEAAGLNPWLALQGASLSGAHQTTAGSGSSARYKSSGSSDGKAATVIASLLIACARIAAAAIAA